MIIVSLLASVTAVYFVIYKSLNFKKISIKKILLFLSILNIILIFIWNVSSDDLYSYIHEARVFSIHFANPYLVPFSNYPSDPLFENLKTIWSEKTSVYGPIFIIISSLLTYFAKNNFLLNILLFKSIFVFCNIFSIYLIYKITKSKIAMYLYGANPIILFELSVDAHNEVLTIFFLLFAIYFSKSKYVKDHLLSVIFITLSLLIKFTTVVLYPFFIIYLLFKQVSLTKKVLFLFSTIIISTLITTLSFIPFWDFRIFDRLLLVSSAKYPFEFTPIGHFLPYSRTIFVLIFLFCLVANSLKPKLINSSIIIYAAFLFVFENLFWPWYITPLIALLSLKKKSFFILSITLYAIYQYAYIS